MVTVQTVWDVVGYGAMVLVTVSLMMRSIVRLRWINLVGAVLFAVYGFAIAAYPVAVLNLAVVGINLYHLARMRHGARVAFTVVSMPARSEFVDEFVAFHRRDIDRYQPGWSIPADAAVLVALCDTVPAGILAITPPDPRGAGRVTLDFAAPAFRDLKLGRHLFRRGGPLAAMGYRRIVAPAAAGDHATYLARMGFQAHPDGFILRLDAGDGAQVR